MRRTEKQWVSSYFSLLVDRGVGLRELAETLIKLFGDAQSVVDNSRSILLCITQAPAADEDGDLVELNHVRGLYSHKEGVSDKQAQVLKSLESQIFIYHPLNKDIDSNSGWASHW